MKYRIERDAAKNEEILITLIKESVKKCYLFDESLIVRGMEQASVARIYYYMQRALDDDERFAQYAQHSLDCEYYKNGRNAKVTPRFKKGTKPDMILHRREDDPCQDNVLILEFKPKTKTRKNSVPQRDKEKLEDFTNRKCGYKYKLGVFVKLNEQNADFRYFRNGREISEQELGGHNAINTNR